MKHHFCNSFGPGLVRLSCRHHTVSLCCCLDRELAMLLSMAQSNPALFQMISDRATIARQLDRLSRLKDLMETNQEELTAKHAEEWSRWVARYRSDLWGRTNKNDAK